jgi:hypothetical protein
MKRGVQSLIVGAHNRKDYMHFFRNDHKPREVHVVYAHFQFDGSSAKWVDVQYPIEKGGTITWPDGGAKVRGVYLDIHNHFDAMDHCFATELKEGGSPIRQLTWNNGKSGKAAKGGKLPLDHAKVDYLNHKRKGGRIWLKLDQAALDALKELEQEAETAGKSYSDYKSELDAKTIKQIPGLTLSLQVRLANGPWGGDSSGNSIVVTPESDTSMSATLCHELGHALGMTDLTGVNITGMGDAKAIQQAHGRTYTGKGHQGGHCAEGLSQSQYDTLDNFEGKSGACIMFGESSSSRRGYCDRCTPVFRALLAEAFKETVQK